MLKTWTEIGADGRAVAFAALDGFQHWVVGGTTDAAVRGLRITLRVNGRDDLVPQLGIAD